VQGQGLCLRIAPHAHPHFAGFEVIGGFDIQDRDILHTRIAEFEQDRRTQRFQDGSVDFRDAA
jgi:hypothetical protein